MKFSWITICVCFLIALPSVVDGQQTGAMNQKELVVFSKAQKLMQSGKNRQAYTLLKKLKAHLGKQRRNVNVESSLASILVAEGHPKTALVYVEPYIKDRSAYHAEWINAYVATAFVNAYTFGTKVMEKDYVFNSQINGSQGYNFVVVNPDKAIYQWNPANFMQGGNTVAAPKYMNRP